MKRPAFIALGLVSLALAVIGAFLPVVPTVPFVLLAAWAFGRSHPEWEARLIAHPVYGPPIRAWRERGAIPLRAKQISTLMMACSGVGCAVLIEPWWRWVPGAVMAVVALWIWSRPSR